MSVELKKFTERRLEGLRRDRDSYRAHWGELANFILPRRYQWLITPNATHRGSPINAQIIDPTGTIAARRLAAGMMAGITSPARPWFKIRLEGQDTQSTTPASLWLAECERRMMQVFAESNFYNALGVMYFDLVVFGTGPIIIYQDDVDIIRCYNPCAGEYFLANSDRLAVDTLYREFVLNIAQIKKWFGLENASQAIKNHYNSNRAEALAEEFVIGHAIEPNDGKFPGIPSKFTYREVYWEKGTGTDQPPLSVRGFYESPFIAPRWDISSNDAYGRGPAMDALPDIKQLQLESLRKAQAIDKIVNPPMVGDIQLKNQPASLLPGGVTYVAGMSNTNPGFRPAYQINPSIAEISQDILEVQGRIKEIFFNDLFLMISQLQTVRTATEIDARREEKLVMLGPVLERLESEALSPIIERTFAIMFRLGLLPPPPQEIQGKETQIEYVSMLATAQRASSTAGIERVLALAGNIAAGQASVGAAPDAMDKINTDAVIDEYASQMNVQPKLIRDDRDVARIRAQRAQAAAKQQAMQDAAAAVQGAEILSKTDVGGGMNALQATGIV